MFFRKKNSEIVVVAKVLYNLIVKQSREIEFYKNFKVPDTIVGRFELIILHLFFIDRTNSYFNLCASDLNVKHLFCFLGCLKFLEFLFLV